MPEPHWAGRDTPTSGGGTPGPITTGHASVALTQAQLQALATTPVSVVAGAPNAVIVPTLMMLCFKGAPACPEIAMARFKYGWNPPYTTFQCASMLTFNPTTQLLAGLCIDGTYTIEAADIGKALLLVITSADPSTVLGAATLELDYVTLPIPT